MGTYAKDSNERILRLRQDIRKQEEWETYKWKCIRCEQNLTHIHFDNDALMPYLENSLSDQPSIPPHALRSEGDSSRTAKGQQDAECHQLLCNECKYIYGLLKTNKRYCPIRSSRYLRYDSFLCRYFPGLAGMSSKKEFTSLDPPRHWPTYMVRCTGCKKWKEIRHYLDGLYFDPLLEKFISDGCFPLIERASLVTPATCDQCTDVQERNLSTHLASFPIWERIDRLESFDYSKWPGIFGERKLIDTEKSRAYFQSVQEEFEKSGGERGLNRERFREEGFRNFTFEINPDGQVESLDEEDIQKVETCLEYYVWLLRAKKIFDHM